MTIVATEDTRNANWKASNVGSTLLKKMGWEEGQGLGRRKQGTAVALRAVRRTDQTLGIGASTADAQGTQGWGDTNDSFASVLHSLKRQHSMENDTTTTTNKRKSKRTKSNKKTELVLARNKVTAGHAKKMRHAKDLTNKSPEDLAAIFGRVVPLPPVQEKDLSRSTKKRKDKEVKDPTLKRKKQDSTSDADTKKRKTQSESETKTT